MMVAPPPEIEVEDEKQESYEEDAPDSLTIDIRESESKKDDCEIEKSLESPTDPSPPPPPPDPYELDPFFKAYFKKN